MSKSQWFYMIPMNEIGEINRTITVHINILAHNRTEVMATALSELRSVHTTPQLCCGVDISITSLPQVTVASPHF